MSTICSVFGIGLICLGIRSRRNYSRRQAGTAAALCKSAELRNSALRNKVDLEASASLILLSPTARSLPTYCETAVRLVEFNPSEHSSSQSYLQQSRGSPISSPLAPETALDKDALDRLERLVEERVSARIAKLQPSAATEGGTARPDGEEAGRRQAEGRLWETRVEQLRAEWEVMRSDLAGRMEQLCSRSGTPSSSRPLTPASPGPVPEAAEDQRTASSALGPPLTAPDGPREHSPDAVDNTASAAAVCLPLRTLWDVEAAQLALAPATSKQMFSLPLRRETSANEV